MKDNPLYKRSQVLEYLLYGFLAAVAYFILMLVHLRKADYESSYLLYIGNAVFGAVILIYNLKLINRPYVEQRAVSMTIAAHLATLAGTIISVLMVVITALVLYPHIFSDHARAVLENAPPNTEGKRPAGWVFMVVIDAFLLNFAVGSFVSIITSYAGKKNQTRDKPTALGTKVSDGPVTNDPS